MVVGVVPVVIILVGTVGLAVGISAIPIARLVHGLVVVLGLLITILIIVLLVGRLIVFLLVVLRLVGIVSIGGICDGRQDDQGTDGNEWADHDDHVENDRRT